MKTEGERLEFIKEKSGLSQGLFAKTIDISSSFYSQIKKNNSPFPKNKLENLVHAHKVNLHWFLTGQGEPFIGGASSVHESRVAYNVTPRASGPADPAAPAIAQPPATREEQINFVSDIIENYVNKIANLKRRLAKYE